MLKGDGSDSAFLREETLSLGEPNSLAILFIMLATIKELNS